MKNTAMQKRILVFSFLAIPILLLVTFTYFAAARLLQFSFTDWNGISKNFDYVGFKNYIKVLTNPEYLKIFAHNFAYLFAGIIQNIVALILAVILTGKMRAKNFFRAIIFMPFLMNSVAVSYMFSFMYNYTEGAFNVILKFLGFEGVHWLSNETLVNYSLAFITFWKCTGYSMIIFIGGLQSVDTEIYEACDLDGANAWQRLWYVTLPAIKRIVELNLFLSISGSLKAFNEAFAITNGGPNGASTTFVFKTVETAFTYSDFGLASAMAIILMIFLGVFTIIQKKIFGVDS